MKRKRISKTLLAAAIALQATLANALGLGDITLRSALDQPFDAQIRLRGVGDLGADQIVVSLASAADFQRAGVERLYSLTELQFEIKLDAHGDGTIQLRTQRPVREPYLDFLIEVRWPTGRVLREYTVLLDLPTVTPAPAPAVRAPATSRPAQRPRTGTASSGGGTWTGGDRYDVHSGDTLWSIANRTRPSGVSVQQMMVALQRSNPDAFIRGNMNLLRAGAVLRIPADAGISQTEAVGEVESQGRDWRVGGNETATRPPDEAPAAPAAAAANTPAERAYLELAAGAAGGSEGAAGGVAGGTAGGTLQEQLTASEENLSAKERENAELQSRVAALEQQVQNYERLVELKSAGGAAAQQAAAASGPDAAGTPAAGTDGASASAAEPEADKAAVPGSTPAAVKKTEPGLLARLMDNSMALGAAVGLLFIGALAIVFMRRRESYAPVPEPAHALRTTKTIEPVMPAAPRREPMMAPAAAAPAAPRTAAVAPAAVVAPAAAVAAAAVTGRAAEPDTGDPVSEADIYVAYGRTERAVEILRAALQLDPDRGDVRLKLMEVLADRGDTEAVLAEYDQCVARGDADTEAAAREMLADKGMSDLLGEVEVPIHVPVAELTMPQTPGLDATRSGHESELLRLDQDVDLDLDEELARASTGPGVGEELSLDIGELDLGDDGGEQEEAANEDMDLDLAPLGDLELGSDAEADAAGLAAADTAAAAREMPASPEDDADLGLLDGSDEIETKLELARAYVDMGDLDGARDILDEVVAEGSPAQREQAGAMLERIGAA